MKISKKELLYEISNLAYVIADTHDSSRPDLHRVRDICEDGNIDRVSQILTLSYSEILVVLLPILHCPKTSSSPENQSADNPSDYFSIKLSSAGLSKPSVTAEMAFRIKETVKEYMIARVLADWLFITLPEAADVWKFRFLAALETLKECVSETVSNGSLTCRRRLSPF